MYVAGTNQNGLFLGLPSSLGCTPGKYTLIVDTIIIVHEIVAVRARVVSKG